MSTLVRFAKRHPDVAYKDWMLWLPKKHVNEQAVKAALEIPLDDTEKLVMWSETSHHIIVPREYLWNVNRENLPFSLEVRTPAFNKVSFNDGMIPRDEAQQAAWSAFAESDRGVLNLACGRGKSALALKKIAQQGMPAIIVVNTKALMEQWLQEIDKFLGIKSNEIGKIQGKVFDWKKPITMAMIHTLAMKSDTWPLKMRQFYGVVIIDEVHHLAAPVFAKMAPLFWGKRFGLTATAERADGTEAVYYNHLGGIFFSDLSYDLEPTVYFQQLDTYVDMESSRIRDITGEFNISRYRKYLIRDPMRNDAIVDHVRRASKGGRRILILGHIIEGLQRLADMLPTSKQVTSNMPQKQRLEIFQTEKIVLATMQLASEGLNAPELDTVFFTTPFRSWKELTQGMGRALRRRPGKKKPLIVIFMDYLAPPSKGMCRSLMRGLKKNGFDINVVAPEG